MRPACQATRVTFALAAILSWPFVAVGIDDSTDSEGTCSAQGDSSEGCRAAAGAAAGAGAGVPADSASGAGAGAPATAPADGASADEASTDGLGEGQEEPQAMADLITQEVEELERYIQLCEERIAMLKDVQDVIDSGHNISLPEAHIRALKEKFPLLAEVVLDVATAPAGSSDDYLIAKSVIHAEEAVSFMKFMPLRAQSSTSSKTTSAALPPALLVTATAGGLVRLHTPIGELLLSFDAGHEQPVAHLAVSPEKDEHTIATGDSAGVVRVFKVSVKPKKPPQNVKPQGRVNLSQERISQFLGVQLNATVQFQGQLAAPKGADGAVARITTMALASFHGTKYFVMGDAEGALSIFTKNGTLQAKLETATAPGASVEAIYSHPNVVIFTAGHDWGFVDFDLLKVRRSECYGFDGRLAAAAMDSQQSSRIVAADEAGNVWVFNTKGRTECRVEHRFRHGATRGVVELASVRGYALGLERSGTDTEPLWSVVALNMSHVGKTPQELSQTSPVSWRLARNPVRSWAVHKRSQHGDLLAFLSEDGRSIEVMELFMTVFAPPASSSFWKFKGPILAGLGFAMFGWRYCGIGPKKKPQEDGKDANKQGDDRPNSYAS